MLHSRGPLRDEEARRLRPRVDPVATARVAPQRVPGARVQRDEACFVEFGVSDREYALAEIHVVLIQAKGFFDPEPRDCEETE